jgi:RHS repeat-associated protein
MKKTLLLLAAIAAWSTIQASAFYNPSAGRWLSRDPINEAGFSLLRGNARATWNLEAEKNLCAFVGNNPISSIDTLGLFLIDYDGCSLPDQQAIETALKDRCEKAKKANCYRCLNQGGAGKIQDVCDGKRRIIAKRQ